jgi:hypothetical protein
VVAEEVAVEVAVEVVEEREKAGLEVKVDLGAKEDLGVEAQEYNTSHLKQRLRWEFEKCRHHIQKNILLDKACSTPKDMRRVRLSKQQHIDMGQYSLR